MPPPAGQAAPQATDTASAHLDVFEFISNAQPGAATVVGEVGALWSAGDGGALTEAIGHDLQRVRRGRCRWAGGGVASLQAAAAAG